MKKHTSCVVKCFQKRTGKQKKWEYFATVKTSGYEHYIGAQALAFCNDAAMTSTETDLSIELKKNFFKQ